MEVALTEHTDQSVTCWKMIRKPGMEEDDFRRAKENSPSQK